MGKKKAFMYQLKQEQNLLNFDSVRPAKKQVLDKPAFSKPSPQKHPQRIGLYLLAILAIAAVVFFYTTVPTEDTIYTELHLSSKYPVVWPAPGNMTLGTGTIKISGLKLSTSYDIVQKRFDGLGFPKGHQVVVTLEQIGFDTFHPKLDDSINEYYAIYYRGNGVLIKSYNVYGAMHALSTLRQMVRSARGVHTLPSTIDVEDVPAFPHRGLMIDTGRTFLPQKLIKETVDTMAFVKLNVLHWHLTDAQNFPYVPPSRPELSLGSTGETYSQQDIKDIVTYAAERGVRVVIEIDTPAHTYSWSVSYPELMTCFDSNSQNHASCPEPPCGALDITNSTKLPNIEALVKDVWKDVMKVAPDSYVHVGGDELKKSCASSPDNLHGDFVNYINHMVTFMTSQGKNTIVWEDIIQPYLTNTSASTLNKDIVIETWLGDHIPEIADGLGHKVIASGTFWYLDVGRNTFFLDNPSWATFSAWQFMYNVDILAGVQNKSNVLGGEACVWGETIDQANFDTLTWPRASVVAEVLWSNPPMMPNAENVKTRLQHANNTRTSVWQRFQYHRQDLVALGRRASPVAPPFCVENELCADYANDKSRNKVVWPTTALVELPTPSPAFCYGTNGWMLY